MELANKRATVCYRVSKELGQANKPATFCHHASKQLMKKLTTDSETWNCDVIFINKLVKHGFVTEDHCSRFQKHCDTKENTIIDWQFETYTDDILRLYQNIHESVYPVTKHHYVSDQGAINPMAEKFTFSTFYWCRGPLPKERYKKPGKWACFSMDLYESDMYRDLFKTMDWKLGVQGAINRAQTTIYNLAAQFNFECPWFLCAIMASKTVNYKMTNVKIAMSFNCCTFFNNQPPLDHVDHENYITELLATKNSFMAWYLVKHSKLHSNKRRRNEDLRELAQDYHDKRNSFVSGALGRDPASIVELFVFEN